MGERLLLGWIVDGWPGLRYSEAPARSPWLQCICHGRSRSGPGRLPFVSGRARLGGNDVPQRGGGGSWRKGAGWWREEWKRLRLAVDTRVQGVQTLTRLQATVQRLAQVQERQAHPSHTQLLNDPDLLDWLA